MKDEQLDKLFRDAAQRYPPPSAPEGAWADFLGKKGKEIEEGKHAEKIARHPKRIGPVWLYDTKTWQLAAACLVLICLGSIGWWFSTKNNKEALPRIKLARLERRDRPVTAEKVTTPALADRSPIAHDKNKMVSSSPKIDQGVIPYGRNSLPLTVQLRTAGGLSLQAAPAAMPPYSSGPPAGTNEQPLTAGNQHKDVLPKTLSKSAFLAAGNQPSVNGEKYSPGLFQDQTALALNTNAGTEDESRGKWQLGLTAGPNLTTVNGSVSKIAGVNTGVVVQHRLNDSKFSVGSGVVVESMAYNIASADFHPGGRKIDPTELTNIEGKCQMVDIPVNVRYDVIRTKKNSAFVSTGVSGLWMANESYTYNYNEEGQPATHKNIDVTGKGKSIYTVTNLSIGYERTFHRTSIQVEPYVKLPMSSIGYGELNLGSLGAQISIKRNF